MFLERLADVSKRIGGSLALCLVDADGIPVEAVSSQADLDLEVLAAEMVAQVRALTDDLSELEAGRFQHYSLTTDAMTLMVSSVAEGYYLLLVLGRGGNRGRARFELRRARLLMESDLP